MGLLYLSHCMPEIISCVRDAGFYGIDVENIKGQKNVEASQS